MRLKIRDVEFSYASARILKNISMELAPSEMAAVCGPNGVGKSTLIKCINRILKPHGSIELEGRELRNMSMMQIARRVGYVPQNLTSVFSMTVFEMTLLGRRPHLGWRSSQTDKEKVIEILELMEIEDLALRDFNELSGGQRQKVIICRALAQEPEILLLDEPTSSLDLRHQLEVMEIIRGLVVEKSLSVIMAVHDLNLASRYADKIIMMKDGRIHSAGDSVSVLTPPNILSVYGVVAAVREELGKPFIVPLKSEKQHTTRGKEPC